MQKKKRDTIYRNIEHIFDLVTAEGITLRLVGRVHI